MKSTENNESLINELRLYKFEYIKPMTKGGYGEIILLSHGNRKNEIVMKYLSVDKKQRDKYESQVTKNKEESIISTRLKGVNLVNSHAALKFTFEESFGILMEKATHCDLNYFIQSYHTTLFDKSFLFQKNKAFFFEKNNLLLKFFVKKIINGLLTLNNYGYAHLDIKPENILLYDGFIPKLCDFGQIQAINTDRPFVDLKCGTTCCMSPEYFNNKIKSPKDLVKVDAYALGSTIYKMLFNSYFIDKSLRPDLSLRKKLIKQAIKTINKTSWIDPDLKNLITQLIQYNLNSRLTIKDASKHKWIVNEESDLEIRRIVEINSNEQIKLLIQMHTMNGLKLRERKRNQYTETEDKQKNCCFR